jgi:23S rRNA pseudouridine1911/1915/1917 synthase
MLPETIRIIEEEPHFWLVDKPAGLFSQAAPGVPSLEKLLAAQIKQRDQHPGNPFVGLPHRLDRATSGIMLIARNRRAVARFGEQFHSRKIDKFYLAVVEGNLSLDEQLWEDSIRKVEGEARAELVAADDPSAKLAQLRIRGLLTDGQRSLGLIQLLTGRMHQIRLQAASRNFPVVDDPLYGPHASQAIDDADVESRRTRSIGLHALALKFRHPQTAKPAFGAAPPPEDWREHGAEILAGGLAIYEAFCKAPAGLDWESVFGPGQ